MHFPSVLHFTGKDGRYLQNNIKIQNIFIIDLYGSVTFYMLLPADFEYLLNAFNTYEDTEFLFSFLPTRFCFISFKYFLNLIHDFHCFVPIIYFKTISVPFLYACVIRVSKNKTSKIFVKVPFCFSNTSQSTLILWYFVIVNLSQRQLHKIRNSLKSTSNLNIALVNSVWWIKEILRTLFLVILFKGLRLFVTALAN